MNKATLIRLHWFLASQLGIDPIKLINAFRAFPGFLVEYFRFKKYYSGEMRFVPCLHDRFEEGGATKGEYFWQDIIVAQWIFQSNPKRHADIGSRIDGFVAHVASFRNIEVFDVRDITANIPGVVFKRADFMDTEDNLLAKYGSFDSISCLHALEHFGLGRYGDPLDVTGHERGIANIARLLELGGTFYLSTPIGRPRIEFNANRVFDPRHLEDVANRNGLVLQRLRIIGASGAIEDPDVSQKTLSEYADKEYNLGILVFKKEAAV